MARCTSLSEPYDRGLSRQLIAYIVTGMAFMLLPGTLLGVMNLFRISASETPSAVDTAWIQAHGHAQIFGWLGTFILGIGFYAIPRLRLSPYSAITGWIAYAIWAAGVTLRCMQHLRLGGILELIAVAIFYAAMFLTERRVVEERWRGSVLMIEAAALGMAAALVMSAFEAFRVTQPYFPPAFNQRFLTVATWGFIVPFVWGFATRWVPPLLGLPKSHKRLLLPTLATLFLGVVLNSMLIIAIACVAYVIALRVFEPSDREPKLRGVHASIAFFLRSAFAWMLIAVVPLGVPGASRHALTVGFMVVTVFCIAPRELPGFFGRQRLFSPSLMFASLFLVTIGCVMRVSFQVLAYRHIAESAWRLLPLSAVIEMTAVVLFAVNMLLTIFYEARDARDAIRNSNESIGII